jgi:hypothetical protein
MPSSNLYKLIETDEGNEKHGQTTDSEKPEENR